jgi:hypothetical protein
LNSFIKWSLLSALGLGIGFSTAAIIDAARASNEPGVLGPSLSESAPTQEETGWILFVASVDENGVAGITKSFHPTYEECFTMSAMAPALIPMFVTADCVPKAVIRWDDENQKKDFNENDVPN